MPLPRSLRFSTLHRSRTVSALRPTAHSRAAAASLALAALACGWSPLPSLAQPTALAPTAPSTPLAAAPGLPAEVDAALSRARLPREAVSVLVMDVQGNTPRASYQAGAPMNPASVMKLVTTYAALDLLGPAFTWTTPVTLGGPVQGGALQGNLYIKGQGDPKLVMERLWLLLKRVQGQGVKAVIGDIVLDRSAFDGSTRDAAEFDGEPQKPYNASADALLINYKSVTMTFVPDRAAGVAQVVFEPPMAGLQVPASVPLTGSAVTECGDWRSGLKAELGDPARIVFAGVYPASCGERAWPVAYADPARYAARAVEGMWRDLGGSLTGQVREGTAPPSLLPAFAAASPPLAEVIRDINKYSNNVMAQQLFLTLSLQDRGLGSAAGSRDVLRQWWTSRFGAADLPVIDNGSGLSRDGRISAQALARMLQAAWASPVMPELLSSLPIAGIDGTLRNRKVRSAGASHLKTGSLRDVQAVAGIVHSRSGRRYVLVAIANHANAAAARPAFDALIDWAARD